MKLSRLLMLGLFAISFAVGQSALAKSTTAKKPKTKTPAGAPTSAPTAPESNQQIIADATAEVQKDQSALNDLTAKLRQQFETSADYTAALDASKTAQAAYTAADNNLLATLEKRSDYKAAVQAKADAAAKLDDLHKDPTATPDQLTTAANESLAAAKAVTQLQADAVAVDPNVSNLKTAAQAAADKVAAMKKAFDASMAANPDWSAAKSTLDQAQAKLDDARRTAGA